MPYQKSFLSNNALKGIT